MTLDLSTGWLDFAYVAPEAMGQGVAETLYAVLEGRARAAGLTRLETEASLLAERFFARRGWRIEKRQEVERNGNPPAQRRHGQTPDTKAGKRRHEALSRPSAAPRDRGRRRGIRRPSSTAAGCVRTRCIASASTSARCPRCRWTITPAIIVGGGPGCRQRPARGEASARGADRGRGDGPDARGPGP